LQLHKKTGSEIVGIDTRNDAMDWIGNRLEDISKVLSLEIKSWSWEICGIGDDTTSYQLNILGRGDKRAIKLFTAAELDRCLMDPDLQTEISARLTPLVAFIGNKVQSTRANRTKDRSRI
jgi:hypothetical protein